MSYTTVKGAKTTWRKSPSGPYVCRDEGFTGFRIERRGSHKWQVTQIGTGSQRYVDFLAPADSLTQAIWTLEHYEDTLARKQGQAMREIEDEAHAHDCTECHTTLADCDRMIHQVPNSKGKLLKGWKGQGSACCASCYSTDTHHMPSRIETVRARVAALWSLVPKGAGQAVHTVKDTERPSESLASASLPPQEGDTMWVHDSGPARTTLMYVSDSIVVVRFLEGPRANEDLSFEPGTFAKVFHREMFKILATGYVWCDVHCSVHVSDKDPYDEGMTDCKRSNWRNVYVESFDKGETF